MISDLSKQGVLQEVWGGAIDRTFHTSIRQSVENGTQYTSATDPGLQSKITADPVVQIVTPTLGNNFG